MAGKNGPCYHLWRQLAAYMYVPSLERKGTAVYKTVISSIQYPTSRSVSLTEVIQRAV